MSTTETRKNWHTTSTQTLAGKDGKVTEIDLERVGDRAELLITENPGTNDSTWGTASLSREELWEHVHNCLGLLHQMPAEDRK